MKKPSTSGQDRSSARSAARELSWREFDSLVQGLAAAVGKKFKPDAVVGVAHGGVFVGGAVASALRCDFYPVRISRRSRDVAVRTAPRMTGQMPKELKGKRVLLVDDVASSGDTLKLGKRLLAKVGATKVATACLVTKGRAYKPDWTALTSAALIVFPWDYEPVAEGARFDVDPGSAGV